MVKRIPLYARPFRGGPVTLPENAEKLEDDENGRNSVTLVRFPVAKSTSAITSYSVKEG